MLDPETIDNYDRLLAVYDDMVTDQEEYDHYIAADIREYQRMRFEEEHYPDPDDYREESDYYDYYP